MVTFSINWLPLTTLLTLTKERTNSQELRICKKDEEVRSPSGLVLSG